MVVPDDLFGFIPLWVAIYALGVIGLGAAGVAMMRRFFLPVLLGKKDERRFDRPLARLRAVTLVILGQSRVLKSASIRLRDLAGIGHAIIFWGFVMMSVSYLFFIFLDPIKPWISGYVLTPGGLKVYFWILDIFAISIVGAVIWGAYRRWIGRPS